MTTINRCDNRLQIFTDYNNIDACRSIISGKWNKNVGCWEYPLAAITDIIEVFPNAQLDSGAARVKDYIDYVNEVTKNLRKGITEPRGSTSFLMKHQRMCRDISLYHNKFAFYCDVGTGKTILGFSIIDDKMSMGVKWLILSPRTIIKTGWIADKEEFYPNLKLLPITSAMKRADYLDIAKEFGVYEEVRHKTLAELPTVLIEYADAVITNPEMYKNKPYISEWKHDGLLVDESSMLRNMDSAITKSVIKHSTTCKYTYLLSGKPAPNSPLEYFSQMLIVNRAIFGNSFYKFREKYFEANDYFKTNWTLKSSKREEFSERLSRGCVFINKHDCIDLPDEMPPVIRQIEMTPPAKKYYNDMEASHVLQLQEASGTVMASTKVAALMKLRQITSGSVIDTEAGSEVMKLHTNKLKELDSIITELGDNKAVIWINFKFEVDDICSLLDKMGKTYSTAYGGTANVDDSIMEFKNDKVQFIVANPKTMKYGITFTGKSMVKNCTYTIYYSMSYSFEDYYQSYHRIYRKGQTEPCTYIYLVCEGTIDEIIYDCVVKKGDDTVIIEKLIDKYAKK